MQTKNFIRPLVIALALLIIPYLLMRFNVSVLDPGSTSTDGINWTLGDFIAAGIMLTGAGIAFEFLITRNGNLMYKAGAALTVFASLALVWVNLAVGIIGSEDNPANALYLVVVAIVFLGSIMVRMQAHSMTKVLFTAAAAQLIVPVIALIVWRPSLSEAPGIVGVFILNALFAMLWAGAALFFRNADEMRNQQLA